MDDSDSDFEDIGGTTNDDTIESEETNLNHDGPQTNAKGKKVRGKTSNGSNSYLLIQLKNTIILMN